MESWKIMHQAPNYSISSKGRVRNNRNDHILKNSKDRYGYPRIHLSSPRKTYTIHRLIMTNNTPESEWKEQVNHIDSNRENSTLENLEWVTAKENIQHVHKSNRNADVNGENNPMAKLDTEAVILIKYSLTFLSNAKTAKLIGVSGTTIDRIRNGEAWKHI